MEPGGAERFVVDLTNELARNNDLVLFVLRDDKDLKKNGFYKPQIDSRVKYVNLRIRPGLKPQLIIKFFRLLKKERPHVVHCHLNLVNYFFPLSLIFKKKIKFIYTLHSSASAEVGSSIERHIRRFFFKHRFFTPVAISDETLNSFMNYYKLESIPVIYNGRSTPEMTNEYENVRKEISSLKHSNSTIVFCHLGRYSEYKNQKMLVSAFNKLIRSGMDIILLIIGEGFEEAPHLVEMAEKKIHFLGVKSNIGDYLYLSDAFCLSSINEGMPISLIEALACGCIPICTPVGGIKDLLKGGELGFISKSVSEEDYINAIKRFVEERDRIKKENLVNYYRTHLSIERCAASYLKLYMV